MPSLPPGSIAPPLFASRDDFISSGRTVASVPSQKPHTLCVFPTLDKLTLQEERDAQYESNIYLVGPETLPLRSQLVSDASVQWAKTREFFENEKILPTQYRPLLPDTLEGYSMTLKGHIRRLNEESHSSSVVEHYQSLDAIFDLFLLLTAGKADPGIFGEDLLDWLNRHYVSPTSEDGMSLADQDQPWRDPQFWPVLVKYAFRGIITPLQHFLNVLSAHPSQYLPPLANKVATLLGNLPRATTVHKSHFSLKRKEWIQQLASLRSEFEGVPAAGKAESWWSFMSDILDVFDGDELVIKRIGRELGLGWLEVVCVWGLWGDAKLQRQHLPELVEGLVAEVPSDPNEIEDRILVHFFLDNLPKAVECTMNLDTWLGAHLADIMQAEGLLDHVPMKDSDLSLRDHCVLTYAETILSDPGQWMVAVDYMQSCGPIGLRMADEILYRVKLNLDNTSRSDVIPDSSDRDRAEEGDTIIPHHVIRFCQEQKREWVIEGVIRTAARLLADNDRLGEALSYSLSADDPLGVNRVVSLVMKKYLKHGREPLIKFVNELAMTIQNQHRQPGLRKWQSLCFVLNYAEFHVHHANGDFHLAASHLSKMFRQEIVPLLWWTTLLNDAKDLLVDPSGLYFTQEEAYEVLRRVEAFDTQLFYLTQTESLDGLHPLIKDGKEDNPRPTQELRRALAKYFARLVLGT